MPGDRLPATDVRSGCTIGARICKGRRSAMTPEEFLDWARLFPEPLFLVSGPGTILAGNGPAGMLVGMSSSALAGRSLFDLVTTSPAQVGAYLRACMRTRAVLPGGLT